MSLEAAYAAGGGVLRARPATPGLPGVAVGRAQPGDGDALSRLVREIVQRVREQRGHRPARVLLVRPSTIPKTSSGKIQRSRLVEMITRDELGDRLLHASGAARRDPD